jgi:hypothetical protein
MTQAGASAPASLLSGLDSDAIGPRSDAANSWSSPAQFVLTQSKHLEFRSSRTCTQFNHAPIRLRRVIALVHEA